MLSPEIIKKIRQIEIATRRLLTGSLVGDSRSAVKGEGFEFDQIRDYQMGDDVRAIDWNSSARMDKLLVKQYIQERNRTVILAVDVSASTLFSSDDALKSDIIAQIASVLALVADYGKDTVSLLLFSDEIELFIPAGRGRQHVRLIMEKLFSYKAARKKTNLAVALDRLITLARSDGIVFLISDFIDMQITPVRPEFIEGAKLGAERNGRGDVDISHGKQNACKKLLPLMAKKYDFIAVRCLDRREKVLPAVGFIQVKDSETGLEAMLDLRTRPAQSVSLFLRDRLLEQEQLFKKTGISLVDIEIDKPFMGEVIRFFRRRMSY